MDDAGVVDAVDGEHMRGRGHRVVRVGDLVDRDRLEVELAAGGAQVGAQRAHVDGVVAAYDHHGREVAAEDRHLRVLDVELVIEQVVGDRGDDPGPVPADGGDGEVAHGAQHRTRGAPTPPAGPRAR